MNELSNPILRLCSYRVNRYMPIKYIYGHGGIRNNSRIQTLVAINWSQFPLNEGSFLVSRFYKVTLISPRLRNSQIVGSSITVKDGEIIEVDRAERTANLVRTETTATRLGLRCHVSLDESARDTFAAQLHVDALEKSLAASYWF